jgi:hypothetical protein
VEGVDDPGGAEVMFGCADDLTLLLLLLLRLYAPPLVVFVLLYLTLLSFLENLVAGV